MTLNWLHQLGTRRRESGEERLETEIRIVFGAAEVLGRRR